MIWMFFPDSALIVFLSGLSTVIEVAVMYTVGSYLVLESMQYSVLIKPNIRYLESFSLSALSFCNEVWHASH